MPPESRQSAPITRGDLAALGGYAVFAALLIAPVRHYIGSMERVGHAKVDNDSFPISTFPMFSEDRRGRLVIPHVIGLTATGERILPHYSHYGAGGLNQIRRQVARDLRQGRAVEVAQRYADSLAERRDGGGVESARRRREATIARLAVVRSRFLFDDYFTGSKEPQAEVVFAECAVGGQAEARDGGRLARFRSTVR